MGAPLSVSPGTEAGPIAQAVDLDQLSPLDAALADEEALADNDSGPLAATGLGDPPTPDGEGADGGEGEGEGSQDGQQAQGEGDGSDDDDGEFILEGFEVGDGRVEDLSLDDVREAVQMRGRYEAELVTRDELGKVSEELGREFGENTPHYRQVEQLSQQMQQYLQSVQPNIQPPNINSIDPNDPGSVAKYQAEMQRYEQYQQHIKQGQEMFEQSQAAQKQQTEAKKARQDRVMYKALERLWPESVGQDEAQRAGVTKLLENYGFPVQEFLDAGDTRMVRVFADLHKARSAMSRANQARSERKAPRVVRRAGGKKSQPKGGGGKQGASSVRQSWLAEGGPEATTAAGDAILAALGRG